MNRYEVMINEGKGIHYYNILAEDFSDAVFQAQKLLKKAFDAEPHNQDKSVWEKFEIISVEKNSWVEVVM